MAVSLGAILKKILLRWLIYLLGLIVVLALLGVSAFVLARPQIDEMVQREIKKFGIESDGWDLSLSGKINLHNMRLNLPDGAQLTASLAALRPPIPGFSGTATLYDVTLTHNKTSLTTPEIDVTDIVMRKKDSAIASKKLQSLMQFDIGSLTTPHLRITTLIEDRQAVSQIEEVTLNGLSQGKIQSLSLANITLSLDDEVTKFGSGAIKIRDIDTIATFSYLSGLRNPAMQSNDTAPNDSMIIGPVTIENVTFDAQMGEKKETFHVGVGSLNSNGMTLQEATQTPIDIIEALAKGNNSQEQALLLAHVFVQSISAFDLDIRDVNIALGRLKSGFQSFSLKPRDWQQLVPKAVEFDIVNFVFDTSDIDGEEADFLKAMGYERIEMSVALSAIWNQGEEQITLSRFDVDVRDMGKAHMTGSFTKVDEIFFSGNNTQIMDAMQHVALHELNITLKDEGAIKNITSFLTKEIDIGADEIMEHLETIAAGSAQALFEDAQQQTTAAEAMLAFLRNGENLNIHMLPTREGRDTSLLAIGESLSDMRTFREQLQLTFTHEGS